MRTITSEEWEWIRERKAAGQSHMSIARCFGPRVTVAVLDAEFGREPHKPHFGFTRSFAKWLMEECPYTWRPDNPNPPEAPWARDEAPRL